MGRKALLISLAIACFLLLPRSASQAVSIDQKRGTLPYIQVSPPRPIQVRFEGIISEITTLDPNRIWRIAGVNILVTANTEVLPVGYPPSVGDRARVEALHQNGQLVGQRITIDIGPIEARIVEFQGAITSIQAGEPGPELVIAGTRVLTTKDTLVMGDLALGFLARVRGELLPDDSVLASEINTESPSVADRNVEFEDEIVQIQPSYWYFGDRNRSEEEWIKVWVTNAEIPNQGRVGLTAEVRGVKQQDG